MLALMLCSGCGSSSATDQATQQDSTSSAPTGYVAPAETEAEGYEVLGGDWEVAAITLDDKIIPLSAAESLEDLYDTVFLGFSKDGSFEYRNNVFITRGTYAPYEGHDDAYLLKAETTSRATIEDGKITETEAESTNKAYLVVTDDDVENALGFVEIDLSTGKTTGNDPVYFTKRGEVSPFDSSGSDSGSSGDSSSSDSGTGYSTTSTTGDPSSSDSSSSTSYGTGNQKAVQRAQQYLQTIPFSHDGLVEQLEYEGFSHEDAVYGADACGADWMEQAVLKAKQYLQTTAFSESGLIDQLVYEGFTQAEAEHGVSLCGADWMEQAVLKAR